MENALEYHNTSSNININMDVKYIPSPSSSLPPLTIQFHLHTIEQYRYIPPLDNNNNNNNNNQTNTKSLRLTLNPSEYMSHDMFYHVMQRNLENMDGEYFDNNRRDRVIQDMIRKIRVIDSNRSKKGLKEFEIVVGVTLNIDHTVSSHGGVILLGEEARRFNGMELLKKMEVDEECRNDDCVICLEKIEKEKELLCLPCSHMFHGDCIIHWLENGHCCPICRYEIAN